MTAIRRALAAALLAAAVFLGAPALAGAQLLTADVNGDGVRDRIDTGSAPAELIVRLANTSQSQRLTAGSAVLDVVAADLDKDGDSDLLVLVTGRGQPALNIWTNAGRGRFVAHAARGAAEPDATATRRLASPVRTPSTEDVCSDVSRLFIVPSAGFRGRALAGHPLPPEDGTRASRALFGRRAPRGPPSPIRIS